MYRVIGKRVGLIGLADEDADRLIGKDFGESLIGLLLLHCPDGLILQNGPECFETICGERVVFDPARTDWTNIAGSHHEPQMTRREWREYIREAAKSHARFMERWNGGNQ